MKKFNSLIIMLLAALVLAACGGDTNSEEPADASNEAVQDNTTEETDASDSDDGQVFTLDELSEYDGKDGNPAYVAVDGVVYDVSGIGAWKDGEHFNGVKAGEDNTDMISQSPHGESVLEDLPVVGTLE